CFEKAAGFRQVRDEALGLIQDRLGAVAFLHLKRVGFVPLPEISWVLQVFVVATAITLLERLSTPEPALAAGRAFRPGPGDVRLPKKRFTDRMIDVGRRQVVAE